MANDKGKEGFWSRKMILGTSIGAAIIFMVAGVIFWGGFNTALEVTNTMEFCISCHEMEDTVYQEYKKTVHYSNRSGVQATCPDCHVPRPWVHKVVRKIQASNELMHKVLGTIDTPEKFEQHRLELAKNVWTAMKLTDSRECRNCHHFDGMNPANQKKRAAKRHLFAMQEGLTCIDCHKGIAHKNVRDQLTDEELEQFEAPVAAYKRPIPEAWLAFAENGGKEQKAEVKPVAMKVAQAPAEAAPPAPAPSASGGGGDSSGVNWGAVPAREVMLFYPGQTGIEWTLNGSEHGGARPFEKAGDRCFDCHEGEQEMMGKKMVEGTKAEETPIPGKRPGIPLQVQAAHEGENLYMRFQWPATEHVPVPFVEGGKMDPGNEVKIALMLSTGDVEWANQAGCWQTCHQDARGMTDAPDAAAIEAGKSDLLGDVSKGITKYLKESRTNLEIKGRRGKKRGGWDKLKSAEEIEAALKANQFMDLLRYKIGTGEMEDGHILASRVMSGGQGAEFTASREGDNWVVVMKRKLVSDKPGDVSITPDNFYNIGFAIHDDYSDGRYHHVSLGYALALDNEDAEINVVKQ
ncbi:MAG: hypothetical protein Kow006_04260 [Gammaproteobacteria bacterium]